MSLKNLREQNEETYIEKLTLDPQHSTITIVFTCLFYVCMYNRYIRAVGITDYAVCCPDFPLDLRS
jgi:hypothetical protein